MDDQEQSMQPAPQHEVPCGAVPQPAEQHRRHQVDMTSRLATAVAAERNVDVVTQELAQRDVPALPEVADIGRPIWARKIQREPHVQHAREPDRHVGITRYYVATTTTRYERRGG